MRKPLHRFALTAVLAIFAATPVVAQTTDTLAQTTTRDDGFDWGWLGLLGLLGLMPRKRETTTVPRDPAYREPTTGPGAGPGTMR